MFLMEIYISWLLKLRVFKPTPEVGIYKRRQENTLSTEKAIKKKRKIERKHALDQEKKKKISLFF